MLVLRLVTDRAGDPRPWFAALLGAYLVCGLVFLGFARTPWQVVMVVGTAVVADFLANRFFRKRTEFPWSGLITGCGLALLLDYGSNAWLPMLPPLLAIGSKHLFTLNGKHVYNPALFGVIAGMLLGGGLISPAPAYQWGGTWAVAMFLGGLAMVVFIRKIGRGWLVGSFLVFYFAQTAFRVWVMRHHVPAEAIWLGTLTAPAFFLFVFYMLTDPATSPPGRRAQIGIAAAIALVDLAFHFRQSYYTLFYAAFTVQTARFAWGWLRVRKFPELRQMGLRAGLAVGLLGVALALDRGPRGVTEDPGFVFVEREIFPSRLGTNLTDIDPRLQHVGKWILSVGDAAAVADVDNDGLQDVFLTHPMKRPEERCTLYRNTGNLVFEEVPIPALDEIRRNPAEYGLPSCAVFADIDNDGDQDLFLGMGFGRSRMFRNEFMETGVLAFTDITDEAGITGHHTCLAAVFFDADRDGDLDLLLGNSMTPYLPDYETPTPLNPFRLPEPEYEGDRRMFHFMHASWHKATNGGLNQFYRNNGDGTFTKEDIRKLGMPETHWTLALNSADFDGDGWPDIYAASDFGPDDLYLNEKGKGFRRVEGKHFGSIGKDTYKGMNVSIADFDRNGTPDIHVSNVHAPLQAEGSLLWMTERTAGGGVRFHNEAAARGALNAERFGWGAGVADLDLNGWPDMVQANGMVDARMDKGYGKPRDYWYVNGQVARSDPSVHAYADKWGDTRGHTIWGAQGNRVLLNRDGIFHDASVIAGLTELGNARGVALADFDNDGDADLLITRQFDPASFYENRRTSPAAWVGFAVVGNGETVPRDATGSVLEISQGGKKWRADVLNVSGFSAQGDRRIVVGLGGDKSPVRVRVTWTDGTREDFGPFAAGRYHQIGTWRNASAMPLGSDQESSRNPFVESGQAHR
jgi:hypothetical protein